MAKDPGKVKIGAICVTERRSPIIKLSWRNFANQVYPRKSKILLISLVDDLMNVSPEDDDVKKYLKALLDLRPGPCAVLRAKRGGKASVPERIDKLCELGWSAGCDLLTMWDDDDWRSHYYMAVLDIAYTNQHISKQAPFMAGFRSGWYVNMRTLRGQHLEMLYPYFWGATLAFNKAAWDTAGGFSGFRFPGYDRAFTDAVRRAKDTQVGYFTGDSLQAVNSVEPIAFSHGDNTTVHLQEAGKPMDRYLKEQLSKDELEEFSRCQDFLVERHIYPCQPTLPAEELN